MVSGNSLCTLDVVVAFSSLETVQQPIIQLNSQR